MRWLNIAYSMTAAACLTLAAVRLLTWFSTDPTHSSGVLGDRNLCRSHKAV